MATDAVTHDPLALLPAELHPCIDHIVTDDGAPVDGIFSEKQMRLLTEPLLSSWPGPSDGRPFVAMANVGLFFNPKKPPLVPDVLLSLDVELPASLFPKYANSYFVWEYDKPPEVVVEIVSNREGGEDTTKLAAYARIAIRYYVIFDPELLLGNEVLRIYRLEGRKYQRMSEPVWLPDVELGLRLWHGVHEKVEDTWLRWVNADGVIIPSGKERADSETQRAELESHRADAESQRADQERQKAEAALARADRLAEQLRKLGIDPNGQ